MKLRLIIKLLMNEGIKKKNCIYRGLQEQYSDETLKLKLEILHGGNVLKKARPP